MCRLTSHGVPRGINSCFVYLAAPTLYDGVTIIQVGTNAATLTRAGYRKPCVGDTDSNAQGKGARSCDLS